MNNPSINLWRDEILSNIKEHSLSESDVLYFKDSKTQQNVLHLIACHDNTSEAVEYYNIIKNLLNKKNLLTLLEETNSLGDLPLHQALWSNHTPLCLLMAQDLIHLDRYDARGRNALMIALQVDSASLIELCLPYTLNLSHCDYSGNNILHYTHHLDRYESFLSSGVIEQANYQNMMPKKPVVSKTKGSVQHESDEIASTLQALKTLKIK
jgi:ankyrin repeat protein